jgi:hypothetical protein
MTKTTKNILWAVLAIIIAVGIVLLILQNTGSHSI